MLFASAAAAGGERGLPLIRIYRAEEYGSGAQNFSATQDGRGVLYFGNLHGVLAYDGAWWTELLLPNDSAVYAVKAGAGDRVGVGAINEFGVVTRDAGGALAYKSLVPLVPQAMRASIGDVREVCPAGDGFAFNAPTFTAVWDGATRLAIEAAPRHCPPSSSFADGRT